jgi:hypothetical protein
MASIKLFKQNDMGRVVPQPIDVSFLRLCEPSVPHRVARIRPLATVEEV